MRLGPGPAVALLVGVKTMSLSKGVLRALSAASLPAAGLLGPGLLKLLCARVELPGVGALMSP